jgi:hypothetical protein
MHKSLNHANFVPALGAIAIFLFHHHPPVFLYLSKKVAVFDFKIFV